MRTILSIVAILVALAMPCSAVNPRHENVISYHSSSPQTIADSTPVKMTVDLSDFPFPSSLYTISTGVITVKASGIYRVTMRGTEQAGSGTYIYAIYPNGGAQMYRTRGDSRDDMSGGLVFYAYYQAGQTISLYLLNVGGDVDLGYLTVELIS